MWMMTQFGFFSVVKDHNSDVYKVRSRAKHDLLHLFPEDRIITTFDSDYRHRVIVDKKELDDLMAKCSDIQYTNFKSYIHSLPDQADKMTYYSKVWGIMHNYQDKLGERSDE